MRTLSIMAFASLLILWGAYKLLRDDSAPVEENEKVLQSSKVGKKKNEDENETLLSKKKQRELDKIGAVINENNVDIDLQTKNQIKADKKVYDNNQSLKEKQALLEESFMDKASSVKDIKRIQDEIVEIKNKMKSEVLNTEKWDPKFIYYLMLQENYTFSEINSIKSLAENGLSAEEINYISELIKEDSFMERIQAFKSQTDAGRAIASIKKKPKEKDDFIDDPTSEGGSMESKLIEMNYNQEEKEEMVYGSQQ